MSQPKLMVRSRMQWSITAVICVLLLVSCDRGSSDSSILHLKLYQNWQLQPGASVGGYSVVAGLGDISILLNGNSIYAPFDGRTQKDDRSCLIFSSPNVPAYLFRLCGVKNPRWGICSQGELLGNADILHVAALRKQPDGTWAMVEPSQLILTRILTRS